MKFVLREDLADNGHFEVKDESEDRLFSGGPNDLAHDGEIDRGEKEVGSVAEVDCSAYVDTLLSLGEDDETGLIGGGNAGAWLGAAIEAESGDFGGCVGFRMSAIRDGAGEFGAELNEWVAGRCGRLSNCLHESDPLYPT